MEGFWLVEDRKSHPMTFIVQVALSGTIERAVFESALETVLLQHPLLRSLVTRPGSGRQRWRYAPERQPMLDWDGADAPVLYPRSEWIDLASEVGLRIWVRQGNGTARLTMQFHHSCCDGIGACQFLFDLLAHYGRLPKLVGFDRRRLLLREKVSRSYFKLGIASVWSLVAEAVRNGLWQRPTPLYPPAGAAPDRHPRREVSCGVSYTFDEHEYRQLRRVAEEHDVTLNDLLVRDLFRTLYAWNEGQKPGRPGKWFRITIPVNLREREDFYLPATNLLGLVALNQRAGDCAPDRSGRLLEAIRRQTRPSQLRRLGSLWIVFVAVTQAVRILSLLLAAPACVSTVAFSNLGDPVRRAATRLPRFGKRVGSGSLVVEEVLGKVPLRPYTRAAFVANTYADRLTLSVYTDPQYFSFEATRRLLLLFVRHLRESGEMG
jgi:hypothetical protein